MRRTVTRMHSACLGNGFSVYESRFDCRPKIRAHKKLAMVAGEPVLNQ
jgi:hypothetical protein